MIKNHCFHFWKRKSQDFSVAGLAIFPLEFHRLLTSDTSRRWSWKICEVSLWTGFGTPLPAIVVSDSEVRRIRVRVLSKYVWVSASEYEFQNRVRLFGAQDNNRNRRQLNTRDQAGIWNWPWMVCLAKLSFRAKWAEYKSSQPSVPADEDLLYLPWWSCSTHVLIIIC